MSLISNERLCKQPSEKRKFGIEFNNVLGVGEVVSQITSLVTQKIDGSVTDLTISTTGIETTAAIGKASLVTLWIEGGTTGNTYRIETIIASSSGAILEGDGILYVSDR